MNKNIKDITGQRFGRLVAIEMAGRDSSQAVMWKCQCDCGNIVVVVGYSLRGGLTLSCGCYHKDRIIELQTTHGMSEAPLGKVFQAMKQRCYCESCDVYHRYGGRGIYICDEWLEDRNKFFVWAKDNGYERGLTIDRIDNNGPYSPENCRWVTNTQNQRNKRTNRLLTLEGKTHISIEWAEEKGIVSGTIASRLARGHSVEEALSVGRLAPEEFSRKTPLSLITIKGETFSISKWLKRAGIHKATYYNRIRKGFTPEQALFTPVDITKRTKRSKNLSAL
jgi:hypothetical protein